MLQNILLKKILGLVMKQLLKQFKLDKIQEYVEKPNELDKKVKKLESKIDKIKKLENKIDKIEKFFSKGKSKLKKIKERF